MSYQKETRIKYELPRGDWTVVVRLSDFAGIPYQKAHAVFLQDIVGLRPNEIDLDEDGKLFAALKTINQEGEDVLRETAGNLYKGIARLALDPDILAYTVPTNQLNPERALSKSFPYLDQDVSLEMREMVCELQMQKPNDLDVFVELDHMLDA